MVSAPIALKPFESWRDAVLGPHPEQRVMMGELLLTLPIYVVALSLLWLGVSWALVSADRVLCQTLYSLLGFSVCCAMARRPWTPGAPPPRAHYVHLLFSATNIALAFALFEVGRVVAMPLLCVVLVFDLLKFTPRQIRDAAMLALLLMLLSVPVRLWLNPADVPTRVEMLSLAGSTLLLPVVALVVRRLKGMQQQIGEQQLELAGKLQQLKELATHDALTGLLNRRHMNDLLDDEIKRQLRVPHPLCLAILDIDFFKHINDTHGHATGDVVLREFAKLTHACLGPVDALARWGGEEFVLLMPDADEAQAAAMLACMRRTVAEHNWVAHAPGLGVKFSAGVACFQEGDSAQTLVARADQALYRAKEQGRDRVVVA